MVTTIQLDEVVKDQLKELAMKLEAEFKERVTYNDVIKYLLQNNSIFLDKSGLKSLRGIISYDLAQKSLEELKEHDRKREKNIER